MAYYIETERLSASYLDYYDWNDVLDVTDILGDGETALWFGIPPLVYLDDAKDYLRYCDAETWGLYEKAPRKIVGVIQIDYPKGYADTVDLGYALEPESRGKGYMTEAVKATCSKLFENPHTSRIRLLIHPANEKSIGVATRCGFKRVETGPDGQNPCDSHGEPVDVYILLKEA